MNRENPFAAFDGYGFRHLIIHLIKAGKLDKALNALCINWNCSNAWYSAHESKGDTQGFLDDISRVWDGSRNVNAQAIEDGDSAPCIGNEIICALMQSSVNSIAGNMPSKLPALLVESGIWTVTQGLSVIRNMGRGYQRANSLLALVPHIPNELYSAALDIAREIRDEDARFYALGNMRSLFINDEFDDFIADTLNSVRKNKDPVYRAWIIIDLAPHLPEHQVATALADILETGIARNCENIIDELAPHISKNMLANLYGITRNIGDTSDRVAILANFAPHLSRDLQRQIVGEVLSTLEESELENRSAKILGTIAPILAGEDINKAKKIAWNIKDSEDRISALAYLSHHLSSSECREVLEQILDNKSLHEHILSTRINAITCLAPNIESNKRQDVLSRALKIALERRDFHGLLNLIPHLSENLLEYTLSEAWKVYDEISIARTLDLFSHLLSENLLVDAMTTVSNFSSKPAQASALTALASCIQKEKRQQALTSALRATREIGDEIVIAYTLAHLAIYLPKELIIDALTITKNIQFSNGIIFVWEALVPFLPKEHLFEAKKIANEVKGSHARTCSLGILAPYLPPDECEKMLSEVLSNINDIENEYDRKEILEKIAPNISETLISDAMAVAWEIGKDATDTLLSLFQGNLLTKALEVELEANGPTSFADALVSHASRLPKTFLTNSLTILRDLEDKINGDLKSRNFALNNYGKYPFIIPPRLEENPVPKNIRALISLIPSFQGEVKDEIIAKIIALIEEIEPVSIRAEAIAVLPPYLEKEEKEKWVAIAISMFKKYPIKCGTALKILVPHLSKKHLFEVLATIREFPNELDDSLFDVITYLIPYLEKEEQEKWIAVAISMFRKYPEKCSATLRILAPYLSEEDFSNALSIIKRFPDKTVYNYDFGILISINTRQEALLALASFLPVSLFVEALDLSKEIHYETTIGFSQPYLSILNNLASRIPNNLHSYILTDIMHLQEYEKYRYPRTEALEILAPHLSEKLLPDALKIALDMKYLAARVKAISSLVIYLSEDLLTQAFTAALEIEYNSYRAEALVALAPFLPKDLLIKTFTVAREMPDVDYNYCASILKAIIPHVPQKYLERIINVALLLEDRSPFDPLDAAEKSYLGEGSERGNILNAFTLRLSEMSRGDIFLLWNQILPTLATRTRHNFLSDLENLSPLIHMLGENQTMEKITCSIIDVSRWWP